MNAQPVLLAITNGTAIDGTGADPIPNATVIVDRERIAYAGPAAGAAIPPGATVLDAGGGTILPGIVDSHAHTTLDPAVRRTMLACGVTSVCDLGSEVRRVRHFKQVRGHRGWRRRREEPAARCFCAGPILTVPGGLPDAVFMSRLNDEVRDPEEARAAVADLHERGADVIKLFMHQEVNGRTYPILSLDQVRAIVEAAHAREMLVRVHVWGVPPTEVALAGGVDVIEHGPKPEISPDEMAEFTASADPLAAAMAALAPQLEARKRQFERMIAQGVLLVPTLVRYQWGFENGPTPKPETEVWVGLDLDGIRQFHALGGTVALGTDWNTGLDERAFVQRELAFYAQAGLPPLSVIEAATRHAARACGQAGQLGTLEPGKLADLIVVDGDPLQDLEVLSRLRAVVVSGEIARGAKLGSRR
jgi:imidazolonepropionase-like amidohydrolase